MTAAKVTFEVILLIILTFSLVIGILSAFVLTSPIKKMVKTLSASRASNFKVKMPGFSTLELNELSSTYNKMTDEIDYLINQVYEKQFLLTAAELEALHSQVNPHFLFNILENINWEARIAKNEKIYEMTLALASLLRSTIYFGKVEKILLSDELQITAQYMKLQKMRFGDRIIYSTDVDEALMECYVPRFCIQSVVENSVIHGLERKRGQGNINVKAASIDGSIDIIVTDDGTGFDASKINLDLPREAVGSSHPHLGLYNTNKRIRLLYGENYGLALSSAIGAGTTVVIHIPVDRKG
jgi:two-component system sensor histidine kinase YesM